MATILAELLNRPWDKGRFHFKRVVLFAKHYGTCFYKYVHLVSNT
jgi:hypothetical protein